MKRKRRFKALLLFELAGKWGNGIAETNCLLFCLCPSPSDASESAEDSDSESSSLSSEEEGEIRESS